MACHFFRPIGRVIGQTLLGRSARRLSLLGLALASVMPLTAIAAEPPAVDWDKARDIYQRNERGEALSESDSAYLRRARLLRSQTPRGAAPASTQPAPQTSTGFPPLTSATAAPYKGFALGLYGDGSNEVPRDHATHAADSAIQVKPLNGKGRPSPAGRIGFVSIGMSNTTMEFSRFVQFARELPNLNPQLTLVDGAQGGRASDDWASRDRMQTWNTVGERLAAAGLTPQQVQVIWIKQARKVPSQLGPFPDHAKALQQDLRNIVGIAREQYPNLKLVYLSSRTYGGYAETALNPEPYAYESGFAVQWLIRSQIDGSDPDLAYNKTPTLLWGPYLWTDGNLGRAEDDLVWQRSDTAADGTHPSDIGREKVAQLLRAFFTTDATARHWFTARNP